MSWHVRLLYFDQMFFIFKILCFSKLRIIFICSLIGNANILNNSIQ